MKVKKSFWPTTIGLAACVGELVKLAFSSHPTKKIPNPGIVNFTGLPEEKLGSQYRKIPGYSYFGMSQISCIYGIFLI